MKIVFKRGCWIVLVAWVLLPMAVWAAGETKSYSIGIVPQFSPYTIQRDWRPFIESPGLDKYMGQIKE